MSCSFCSIVKLATLQKSGHRALDCNHDTFGSDIKCMCSLVKGIVEMPHNPNQATISVASILTDFKFDNYKVVTRVHVSSYTQELKLRHYVMLHNWAMLCVWLAFIE